ncbi:MAG: hypothetical protein ACFFAS_18460 [Promethearchaeota archaeon]
MEIEKKRETSWKIALKKKDENIELTSVEISGVVRQIKLAIINRDNSINVEMNKDEFFNFLSLISAFKDVVIGEESIILDEEMNLISSKGSAIPEITNINESIYQDVSGDSFKDEKDNELDRLDPEEWDPW